MNLRHCRVGWMCAFNVVCALSVCCRTVNAADALATEDTVFAVPRADTLSVDKSPADWSGKALDVNMFCCARGMPWPKATSAPSMQVAWNGAGLLASVTVHHSHPWEFDYVRHLFQGDSVEFFVAPQKGSRDRYMLIISPGLDPRYPEPRHCFFADPSEAAEKDLSDLTFQCTREKTSDGYTMRVQLPWSNLHIEPKMGMELALQVYVMEAEPNTPPVVAMWNPAGESFLDPRSTQRIRLSEKASPPVIACATAQDDAEQKVRAVRIVAPLENHGKQFELRSAQAGVVYGTLLSGKTQAFATISLASGQGGEVIIDGAVVPFVVMPPQNDLATIMSQSLKCKFQSCVFQGEQFPGCYLEGVRHYRVAKVDYFDADYRPVSVASIPGRYGAVVEIADASGRITRRFRTLFRIPNEPGLFQAKSDDLKYLPRLLAADRDALSVTPLDALGCRDNLFLTHDDALSNPDTAALAATLFAKQRHELTEDVLSDFRAVDRQWWVGLKRKLYGWDRQFPKPFISPVLITGAPATVVHEGTDAEAGVVHEMVKNIEEICKQIVGEFGEPVSICLVRHGVVFFHHAYGQMNGRPFTVDDPVDIMSATKPLGGALMMQVLDAGSIQPDEAIDKVLPCFARIPVKRPMTIRDLYTHLNGLTGDWGDQIHDTEEIVAGYYSTLDTGDYSYNEVGFALGGKVIEAVTGEGFPQFAKRHLLDPLGMDHTRVTNSGGHTATTSLDYARFGQMLLNRGSYGAMRFFSEATFAQMLPSSDGSNRRGMGLVWMPWQKYGFGKSTFGHGAGNSSVLVVDPVHDLVLVIVSGGGRKDFRSSADPFYRSVIMALD